jgi:arsenate reductase-like glutaredoxin family protein
MTCTRAQEFLELNNIEAEDVADARKKGMGRVEALILAKTVNEIYSFKGKKVTHINMWKDHPSEQMVLDALLGPTGNLRAPTMKVGEVLLVGFNEEHFSDVFGKAKKGAKSLR